MKERQDTTMQGQEEL